MLEKNHSLGHECHVSKTFIRLLCIGLEVRLLAVTIWCPGVGLLGEKITIKGEVVETEDVFVGGRSGPNPKMAIKLLADVPCEILPEVLSGLRPYHS